MAVESVELPLVSGELLDLDGPKQQQLFGLFLHALGEQLVYLPLQLLDAFGLEPEPVV